MKVKDLKAILNDPMIDEELDIFHAVPNEVGVESIEKITEVYNGFNQIVGYTIV
jgi:hypothetical protein